MHRSVEADTANENKMTNFAIFIMNNLWRAR
jgi:hypothetical protein